MKILVTGGTGLLGNNVIRQLVAGGDEVLAVVRRDPAAEVFAGLDIECLRAPLDDSAAMSAAIAQCDAVIHSAGVIHIGWKRRDESMAVNCDATAGIAQWCRKHQKRLVFVGTVNTVAIGTRDHPSDETTDRSGGGGQIPSSYVLSKRAGLQAIQDHVQRGLDAVVVHPGFMLGPYDWKPSSGRMMVEVGRAWRPVAPAGGCSLCDVRDVAAGTIAALRHECEPGREFILAGHNWTYLKLWSEMAQRMGRRSPLFRVGPLMRAVTGKLGDAISKFSRTESDLNSAGIAMSSQYHFHDSSRAVAELGYSIRPAEETLDDAAEWLKRFLDRSESKNSVH
ncbi:MAG: NAD-dependent epimerase/dehydratase family protein [Planctomycetota bacterium]